MARLDLSFVDLGREAEVEVVDTGRSLCEFTLAPGPTSLTAEIGEGEEDAVHGRPVDDVLDADERLRDLPRYVAMAQIAFQERGLVYPFEVSASHDGLTIKRGEGALAVKVADLSRIVRQGIPTAARFEKRAFRAAQKWIGGWGMCVGAPRETRGIGGEKAIRHFRGQLLRHEAGGYWPDNFTRNGDEGADGFLILGRGWGGPIVYYQSKNTSFDLESYPEEFGRMPSVMEDWFGRKLNTGRRVIPVLALNTILTIALKEQIFEARGEAGVHILDAVDILASEEVPSTHTTRACNCLVL